MTSNHHVHQIAIIGGGCSGLSAAIYCARAELKPILFADGLENKGGLLTKTSIVENYPGFPDGINGFDLIEAMEQQAIKYGTKIIDRKITKVHFHHNPFVLTDDTGSHHYAKTVIICTGSRPNRLGLEKEDQLWSRGISSCAVCDGALYRNKKIVVVGGGDSAMEEALFLTKFSDVTLVHRKNEFKASKIMQDRVLSNPKIKILYNTHIKELHGEDKLESISLENKHHTSMCLPVDGLFYGLGLKPNTELFRGILQMDDDGYILNKKHNGYETMTSIKGIFVAGDANDKHYRQAVVACGDGCKAALEVINYLEQN